MGTHAFVSLSNFTNTYEKRRKRNVSIRTTNKYSHKRHTFRRNYRSVSLTCNKNKYHFSKIYGKFAQILGTGIHLLLLNNEEKKIEDFLPLQPSKLNLIVHQPSFSRQIRPRFAFVSLCYYGTALCLIAPRPGHDHLKRVSRAPLFPNRKCGCALKSCSRTSRLSGRRNTELHGRSSPACERGKHFIVAGRLQWIAIVGVKYLRERVK